MNTSETSSAALVESLSAELTCVICSCVFVDPRVLRCQHCFCLRCLFSQTLHDRGNNLSIRCVFRCHDVTTTTGNIRTLPKNAIVSSVSKLVRGQLMEKARRRHEEIMREAEEEGAESPSEGKDVEGDEFLECEWCSRNTPDCDVCPRCLSRVCGECRGQFSDHDFLCSDATAYANEQAEGAADADYPAGTTEEDALRHYPFLFSSTDVPLLIREGLGSIADKKYVLSDVQVVSVEPTLMGYPKRKVECVHGASGFSVTYHVFPPSTINTIMVSPSDVRWDRENHGVDTFLLLSNLNRLGSVAVQNLEATSVEVNAVLDEVSSAARQKLVTANQGFLLFAYHVAAMARAQLSVARSCVLPTLMRARIIEGMMGDLVINRYHQMWLQAPQPEKPALRARCVSFMNIEIRLCRQLDRVLASLDAMCEGLDVARLRLLEVLLEKCEEVDSLMYRSGSTPRRPPSSGAGEAAASTAAGPAYNIYADTTFLGQFSARQAMAKRLTRSLLSSLDSFTKARHWLWFYANTTMRDTGLSEEERAVLIQHEENMQVRTDQFITNLWQMLRQIHAKETHLTVCDANGTAWSFSTVRPMLMSENLSETKFSLAQVSDGLNDLNTLRGFLVRLEEESSQMPMRNFDTQQQLLDFMKSLLKNIYEVHEIVMSSIISNQEARLELGNNTLLRNIEEVHRVLGESPRVPLATLQPLIDLTDDQIAEGLQSQSVTGISPLMIDFSRRDMAIAGCTRFGQELINASHGVRPEEEEPAGDASGPQEQQQQQRQPSPAVMATPTLFPRPATPSPRLSGLSGGGAAPALPALDLPSGELSGIDGEAVSQSPSSLSYSWQDVDEEGGEGSSGETDVAAAHYSHRAYVERLFAADLEDVDVAFRAVSLLDKDPEGVDKAHNMFRKHFRFNASEVTMVGSESVVLPFYTGTFRYGSGEEEMAYAVDGQTGHVWLTEPPPRHGTIGVVARVLSSPLFVMALNGALVFVKRSTSWSLSI